MDHVNFAPDYTKLCVGMIWSSGGCYATWFSADPAAIHAINLLVISAGSLYIGRRPDYITKFDTEGYNGNWDDQFNEMLVFSDPAKAMQRSNNGTQVTRGGVVVSARMPVVHGNRPSMMKMRMVAVVDTRHAPRLDANAARMEVFDMRGRKVLEQFRPSAGKVVEKNPGAVSKGIYLISQYE